MAIVNHNWLPQPQFARETLKNYGAAPALPNVDPIEFLQIGPRFDIPSGRQDLTAWYVGITNSGDFNLYYHDGSQWVFNMLVLNTQMQVDSIWFDFDQNGRSIILINSDGEIWLNFPNAQNVLTLSKIADGTDGSIVFDHPFNLRRTESDLIVFYKNESNQLAYRYQRDRYDTEYIINGIEGEGLRLGRSSYTDDFRVQLRFSGLDFSDGVCQPVSTVPNESFETTRVRAIQELPNGKILVGRRNVVTSFTGLIGLADSLQDIADENITNEIQTTGYAEFAVLFSDSQKTIVASSNAILSREDGEPMELTIYSVSSSDQITELSRTVLLDGSGSLQGLAYSGNMLYCLIKLENSNRRVIYNFNVTNPETGQLGEGDFLTDNLESIIGPTGSAQFLSLAHRNNALFLCNSSSGELHQIDLTLMRENCSIQLTTESTSNNIGVNVSFNNDSDQIWSVQQIAENVPIDVYNVSGEAPPQPVLNRYVFESIASSQTISRGQALILKRLSQGEFYALYRDGFFAIYPTLQDYLNNTNSIGSANVTQLQDAVQAANNKIWFINDSVGSLIERYTYNPLNNEIVKDNVSITPSGNSVLPRGIAYNDDLMIMYLLSYQTKSSINTPVLTAIQLDANGDFVSQSEIMELTNIDSTFNGSNLRAIDYSNGVIFIADRINRRIYQINQSDNTLLDGGQLLTDTSGSGTLYKIFVDDSQGVMYSIQQFQGNLAIYPFTLDPVTGG